MPAMTDQMSFSYVLVTGATGLVGAHVVDNLLHRGIRVRAIARSKAKAERMIDTRPQFKSQLDFYFIDDLTTAGIFEDAVKDVDGIIHVASPLRYDVADKEKELIIPAIEGVRSLLEASVKSNVKRIVMTSSFGAVLDMAREESLPWTYSSKDWNPITYSEAADPRATPQDAYRGSKTFAEREAWKFIREKSPNFSLVTLCPSMIFGPVATLPSSVGDLNESNALLWKVASDGPLQPLPPARFNFWIDVRDLAEVHVQALTSPEAGGKRYFPVAPEKFNYQKAAEIMSEEFPSLAAAGRISMGLQGIKEHINADTEAMRKDFPNITYRTFRQTVVDFVNQMLPVAGC